MGGHTYGGLRLLPAVLVLLDVDRDPVARQAVTVVPVEVDGLTGRWTEDEVTIDWARLENPQRGSTARRLAAIARSMLDGTPVDLREISHFGHGAYALLVRALFSVWPDPPPSIDDLTASGWREVTPDEFRRRAGDDGRVVVMSAQGDSYIDAARDAVRAAVDSEHDFGGWLARVLQDVARERGGSEGLVAGRPGSWEADHVRRLAAGADLDV